MVNPKIKESLTAALGAAYNADFLELVNPALNEAGDDKAELQKYLVPVLAKIFFDENSKGTEPEVLALLETYLSLGSDARCKSDELFSGPDGTKTCADQILVSLSSKFGPKQINQLINTASYLGANFPELKLGIRDFQAQIADQASLLATARELEEAGDKLDAEFSNAGQQPGGGGAAAARPNPTVQAASAVAYGAGGGRSQRGK